MFTTYRPVTALPSSPTKLRRLATSGAGYALRPAVATLVFAMCGGLDSLVREVQVTWVRLRRLHVVSRDEAGYTIQGVIMTALLAALVIVAGTIVYTQVISKAIHTRTPCVSQRPCG